MNKKERVLARMTSTFGPGIAVLFTIAAVASIGSGNPGLLVHTAFAQTSTLAQPVMSPVQCASDGKSVKLSWKSVSGAGEYAVYVDDPSNNKSSCTDGWYCRNTQDYSDDSRSGTSISRNTTSGKTYQWWVRAKKKDTWAGASSYTKVNFTCGAVPTPPSTPQPTCTISASVSPATYGSNVLLTKTSSNATSAILNGVATSTSGTVMVNPLTTTLYTLNVTGAGGSGSCSTSVVVPPPPTNISASCTGNNLNFSWTAPSGYTHFYTRINSGGVDINALWKEDYIGTSQTLVVDPTKSHKVWVHTRASNGAWSSATVSPTITCTQSPATCTPDSTSPQTQLLACPMGQTGAITQTRTSSCPAGASTPAWSAWTTVSNTCAVLTSTSTAPSIQPTSVPTKVLLASGNTSPLVDFMIQDVCINAQGQPTKGDPAVCSAHRDLRFGELVPYLRTNFSKTLNWAYNASMNYPTQAPDGTLMIMKTMEYGADITQPVGNGTNITTQFRDYEEYFSGLSEGFDLQEANGGMASFVSTQVAGYYPFWRPGCGHDDAWILFPFNLAKGTQSSGLAQISLGDTCPAGYGTTRTTWSYDAAPYTYASGKKLETLYSYVENIDANGTPIPGSHIETFFFTKEYGNAKWESWFEATDPAATAAAKNEALSKCGGVSQKQFGPRTLVLGACEDWTFTKDFDFPFNPLTYSGGRDFVFSKNMLTFGDFAGSRMDGWVPITSGAFTTSAQLMKDLVTKNAYLDIGCFSGCNNNGIYQDVNVSALRGTITLRYGALLKQISTVGTSTAQATLALSLTDLSGGVQNVSFPVMVGNTWQNFGSTLQVNLDTKPLSKIRYQIIINDRLSQYSIDEAYLVPSK